MLQKRLQSGSQAGSLRKWPCTEPTTDVSFEFSWLCLEGGLLINYHIAVHCRNECQAFQVQLRCAIA